MEVHEAIEKRCSVRSFTNEKVSEELVKDILNSGRLAPSAKNRQPWYFVVINQQLKDEIADWMIQFTEENDETEERKMLKCPSSVAATAHVMKEAPVLLLVFKSNDKNWVTGDTLSLGACIENMLLRATELGLGTLWIRDMIYVKEKVEKLVNLEGFEFNSAVLVGYAKNKYTGKARKKLEEIVKYI